MAAGKKINKELKQVREQCKGALLPVRDALEVLSGNWKLPILTTLLNEPMRFKQISKEVTGITDKMLSKELKALETHQLITRTVYDTFPPTVEYAITQHGHSLGAVIVSLRDWGNLHRRKVMGK